MKSVVYTVVLQLDDETKDGNEVLDDIYDALSNKFVFTETENCDVELIFESIVKK